MNKPGCFGSVIYHDPASRRCGVCPIAVECTALVAENKIQLDGWFQSLKSKDRKQVEPKRVSVNGSPSTVTATEKAKEVVVKGVSSTSLNKKPREFVEKWTQKGIKFDAYKDGTNPFALCGNKFASVAMDFFMRNPGGVTKLELTDELVEKCGSKGQGWGLGTAASHAGIVIEAFEYLGVVHKMDGKVHLR